MSQGFKSRFDQMLANSDQMAGNDSKPEVSCSSYSTVGHARFVCFGMPDGRRLFLNYSYLVSGEYNPEDDTIQLVFSSHLVVLIGTRLESLYFSLMHQTAMLVVCFEPRYKVLEESDKPVIQSIAVVKFNT